MGLIPESEINKINPFVISDVVEKQERLEQAVEEKEEGIKRDFSTTERFMMGVKRENPQAKLAETTRQGFGFGTPARTLNPLTFDPIDQAAKDGLPDELLEEYAFVESDKQYRELRALHLHQLHQKDLAMNGGLASMFGMVVGGAGSITSFIPALKAIKDANRIKNVVKGGIEMGAATGMAVSIDELMLQAADSSRDADESVDNIIGGLAIGGVIGGLMGVGLPGKVGKANKATQGTLTDEMAIETAPRENMDSIPTSVDSVGAARVQEFDTKLEITNKAKEIYFKTFGKLSPSVRLLQNENQAVRQTVEKLTTQASVLEKNVPGKVSEFGEPTIDSAGDEILRKEFDEVPGIKSFDENYRGWIKEQGMRAESLKHPFKTRDQFGEQVTLAMINGDVHANKFIQKTAQDLRKTIYEPRKQEMIKAGLLEEDVTLKSGDAYQSQVWIKNNVNDYSEVLKRKVLQPYLKKELGKIEQELRSIDDARSRERLATEFSDLDQLVDEVSNEVINKLTIGDSAREFLKIEVETRGPMKERTINVPMKSLIGVKTPDGKTINFIETDPIGLMQRYNRIAAGEVALKNRFDTTRFEDVDLDIRNKMNEEIEKIQASDLAESTRQKKIAKLRKDTKEGEDTLQELWNMVRGNFSASSGNRYVDSMAHGARALSFWRLLGSVLLASLPDVANRALTHGITNVIKTDLNRAVLGVKAILGDVEAKEFKGRLKKEAEQFNAGLETDLQTRTASMFGVNELGMHTTGMDKFINSVNTKFTKATFITGWNDRMSTGAAPQHTGKIKFILEDFAKTGKINEKDATWLNTIGIGSKNWKGIAEQIEKYGEVKQGLHIMNTSRWDNKDLAKLVDDGVSKAILRNIIRKEIGDVPLVAETWYGKVLFQFMNFAFAQNAKILGPAIQRADARVAEAALTSIAIGMAVYAIRETIAGRELSDDPEKWVFEGIDRSGILSIPMAMNMYSQNLTGVGLENLTGDKLNSFELANNRSRVLGAPIGTVNQISKTMTDLFDGEWTERDIHNIRLLAVAQNHFAFKFIFDQIEEQLAEATGAK